MSRQFHCFHIVFVYAVADLDIRFFLEPGSCWATVRNGNSISTDVTEFTIKTIRTMLVSGLFRQFGSCLGGFCTLYDNYRLLHGIFHIITFISTRSWDQPESRYAQWMIYERGLIKGMIWKMTCYDMFIVYFNRGHNWFVPKCLVNITFFRVDKSR